MSGGGEGGDIMNMNNRFRELKVNVESKNTI